MAPGSCVHESSWAIDSCLDPEKFHPDDLQQCLSTSSFQGRTAQQRWPQVLVSMKAPRLLILQWILRTFIRTTFNNHHLNHSFPFFSLGNSIPCWGMLSAQYLRAPASAVRPKLESSVCHKREVGSLSYTS